MNNKVKKLFAQLIKLSQQNIDGTTLIYEGELGIGTEVFAEDENGEIVPAPDGKYGEWTVVGGVIVEPEKVDEEMAEEEKSDETVDSEKEALLKENEELKARIAELEAKIEELTNENEALSKQEMSADEMLKTLETKEEIKDKSKNKFSKYFN